MKIPEELITKYNVPAPRYTSYPTVPFWEEEQLNTRDWLSVVKRTFDESNAKHGISLYIHLPFCESLCTYCACNTRITRNHAVEESYIHALLDEWAIYLKTFGEKPILAEIHLGGGTPTFFSPENLEWLINSIKDSSQLNHNYQFSFEGHPNNTSEEHLQVLYDLGFRRVSFGVQDLSYKVQKTINRIQPFEKVKEVTDLARKIGYTSVNFDLIYGLPFQTENSVLDTITQVVELKPDRIAFYSYAHVPWKRPGQRAYTEEDLPDNDFKRKLYELGKKTLLANDYFDVGMDHFALKEDELYKAYLTRTMHRNFMGYTTAQTDLLIGLGASSISDAKYAYAQNEKKVEKYKERVTDQQLALTKGHFLTKEDLRVRKFIIDIACSGEARWNNYPQLLDFNMNLDLLTMAHEGLITLYGTGLRVNPLGMAFLRNICMVFDKRLSDKKFGDSPMFSKAI